ncbi:MAG: type IV secretion system DNA-binding domain-containing protein [Clostridia bacterium]|nr:type IV secretion system DNA-binding domain-containing protein [Clostridia bacterium]
MKNVEVFDGNYLADFPVPYPSENARCAFIGSSPNGQNMYVPLDEDILSRHMMILGGIGMGKTNAFFQIVNQIQANLTANDVMIVFDTKGDFYKKYYRPGDVVISNDSTATGPNGVDYWNIFNEIEYDEHMEENIIEIAKMLFHNRIEKTNQPFFPNAAKDIFAAILTHFSRNNGTLRGSNKYLREFLDCSPTAKIREMLSMHEDLKAMISYIFDDRSPQTQGVISELQQMSREIFLGNFKKDGNLSMRKLVRAKGGRIIFIEYDLGVGGMLSPIYSLLYDLAIKEALCRDKSEGNVYFITDEFSLIPNLEHIDDAVNFGRSLGVKFMIGIQNIDQIFEGYGENRARSILSGFSTSVVFRVNDVSSKKFIQELHGMNRKKEIFSSAIQGRGITEQLRDAYVVEDWDITRLARGEVIIGLPGVTPFKFKLSKV